MAIDPRTVKRIRVLGNKTRLRWNSRGVPKDSWGDYDPVTRTIRVAKAPPLQQKEALLHEIGHAIEQAYGFDVDHDQLTLLLRGLLTTLRDNPDVVQILFSDD